MGNHVSAYQAEVIDLVSDAEDERENEDVEVFDVEDSDGDVAFLDEMPREHRAPGTNDNSMAIDRPSINDNQTVAYSPNFDVSEDSQIHNHIYENRFGAAAASSTTAADDDYHYQVPSMLQQENIPTSPSSSLPSFYERMIQQGSSDLTVEERALIENCIRLIKAKDRLEHYNNQQQQLSMMQTPEEHASPGGGDGGNNLEVHDIAGPSISSSSANVAMNVSSSSDVTEYPASTTSSSTPSTEIASNSSIRLPLPGNGRGRGRPFGSAQSKYYRRRLQQDPEGTRRRAREARERFFNSMTPEQRRSYVKGLYRKKVTTEITSD